MSIQLYDKLTLLCMAAAIGSALLFDKIAPYSWVAGALGIVSACASISMYLFFRERQTDVDEAEAGDRATASRADLSPASGKSPVWIRSSTSIARQASLPSKVPVFVSFKGTMSATAGASRERESGLGVHESINIAQTGRRTSSTWMVIEIGIAGEAVVRVRTKRRKRITSWDSLLVTASGLNELAELKRNFRSEDRRQSGFASPEILPEGSPEERLYH